MRARRAVLAAALLAAAATAGAAPPRAGEERVVLRTAAGDIVLALYPDAAPRHVEQFLKLVRLGVYDGANVFSIVPDFYAEVGVRGERGAALSAEQTAAIHPLKAEFSALHHEAGTLSMARDERDPDSAETAFSIILADWPQGDGRYTVFGRVESGMDAVSEMVRVPRDEDGRPITRLEILKAEVVRRGALARARLAPARPVALPPELIQAAKDREGFSRQRAAAWGIALMILIGVGSVAVSSRYPRVPVSLALVNVLIGFFLLTMILAPTAHLHPALATALFLGLLGTLRLMSQFEALG